MDASREKAQRARAASLALATASDAARAAAVDAMANALANAWERIREANERDLREAKDLAAPLRSRLKLTREKLALTLAGIRQVAAQPDPLGRALRTTRLDEGLILTQTTVPLGVVACVFESRPDVAIQIPALAIRSGNAVILKGGAEAQETLGAIVATIQDALDGAGLPRDAVQSLADRAQPGALLAHDDLVDLVIPRGSSAFVRHVKGATRIPVLGHAEGVCHVYVDAAADTAKAVSIALDGKLDNPSACNATECIVVHRAAADRVLPALLDALAREGVEVRRDDGVFGQEFGGPTVALAIVADLEAAVAFVNRHGSKHTDAIVTEDPQAARRFVEAVDSAGVFVNASTRFADGYRYGLGAEVGISTGKVHARGPVGIEGLTTTKWILVGQGHLAAPYQGTTPRPFLHEALSPRDPWT